MSVFNASRLIGKNVLITGASAGIGAVRPPPFLSLPALCAVLMPYRSTGYRYPLRQGACGLGTVAGGCADPRSQGGSNLVLCARRVDALKAVAEACAAAHKESGLKEGGKFVTLPLDVSDKKQIASFLDNVPADLRNIDILGDVPAIVVGCHAYHLIAELSLPRKLSFGKGTHVD